MLIKFNNIRDLSDARYAAAAMAEWIGFSVGKTDSLTPQQIQEIIGWCAGPKIILELSEDVTREKVMSMLDVLPIDGVEATVDILKKLDLPEGLIEIILTEQQDGKITHSSNPGNNSHIYNCTEHLNADLILNQNIGAISLDCKPAENPALKNFDHWTDFLEALEVF